MKGKLEKDLRDSLKFDVKMEDYKTNPLSIQIPNPSKLTNKLIKKIIKNKNNEKGDLVDLESKLVRDILKETKKISLTDTPENVDLKGVLDEYKNLEPTELE